MTDKKPSKLKSWILASRPKTLLAPISPVLVGTSLSIANDTFNLIAAIVAVFCAVLITVGTNFVNDLYDFLSGKDTEERLGPLRVLAAGLISEKEMKWGIYLVFGLTFLAGLYLVYIGGWIILLIGIISMLAGVAYTAGPYPLAYNGLGDIFVFVFFGLVATCGTYFVQSGEISILSIIFSIPIGLLITNILVVNNFRDIDEDRKNRKKTLAVIFGKTFTKVQFIFSMICSYLCVIVISFSYDMQLTLLPLISFPLGVKMISQLNRLKGKELNNLLALTAKFCAIFSLLLSIGIIL